MERINFMNNNEYTISVPEAGERYFGIAKNSAYQMAARGELPVVRVGRLLRVPVAAMERMMEASGTVVPDPNSFRSNYRFTPEDDALITADYAAYVPTEIIADKLGRSEPVLRQRVLHLALHRSRAVSMLLQWAPEHLAAAIKSGELQPEEFISRCHEWRNAQRQQEREQQSERSQEQHAELLRLAEEIDARTDLKRNDKMRAKRMIGFTLEEIGEQYGLTRERIRQLTSPDYKPSPPAGSFSPMEKLARLEQRAAKAREAVIEETLGTLRALWDRSPPEVQQRFRQYIEGEL